jgi:hypothetical protein
MTSKLLNVELLSFQVTSFKLQGFVVLFSLQPVTWNSFFKDEMNII